LFHFFSIDTFYFFSSGPIAADALRHRIEEQKRWRCRVPDYREQVDLT
jgi:metallo-beta-lactamase family protein